MPSIVGYCWLCHAEKIQFEIVDSVWLDIAAKRYPDPRKPAYQLVGKCTGCLSNTLFYYGAHMKSSATDISKFDFTKAHGNITYFDTDAAIFNVISQMPNKDTADIPDSLPENVRRAFFDAEQSFIQGHWNQAASSYGKAVDRGITPLLEEMPEYKKINRPMLGQKLGLLEKLGLLPPAMLEWIELIKDDRNFALHHNDIDFEAKEEVEPSRKFARTLLEYLFTLPADIERSKPTGEC